MNNASSPQTTASDQSKYSFTDRSPNNFQDSTMIDSYCIQWQSRSLPFMVRKGNHLTSLPTQYSHKNELVNINTPALINCNECRGPKNDGIKLNVVSAFKIV